MTSRTTKPPAGTPDGADAIKVWPAGYTDTPKLPEDPSNPESPESEWHVHDPARPQPKIVTPRDARGIPSDAVVLFDGTSVDAWQHLDERPVEWFIDAGELQVVPKTGDIRTRQEFSSCQLHVEWQAPTLITATSQGRGNSGVFLLGCYEVQVLDGYDNPTYADGMTGALYGQHPPQVNACVPPGEWHSYDIVFEAPEFADDRLKTPAYITVFHNGVLLHHRQRLDGPTVHRELANYDVTRASSGPLVLQDHRDDVRFRNIWLRELP